MTRWLAILPLLALIGFAYIGIVNLNRAEKPTTALSDGRDAPARIFETLIGPELSYDFSNTASDRPCLLYTSPSPRDQRGSRMPSSA